VVLVIGAGCSLEPPTDLPLAAALSSDAFRQLVVDQILVDSDVGDPGDLALVADKVFEKTGAQEALVDRMPVRRFQMAKPNEGYLIAAALMREQIIGSLLTLNYDLAATHALVELDARDDVSIIEGPDDSASLGLLNLVYLHRSAQRPPSEWILRPARLEPEWEGTWEQVVAARFLAASVVLFVGLGSAATLLAATLSKVRSVAIAGEIYQVGPEEPAASAFFGELQISEANYIRLGWGDLMRQLGERVAEEHRAALEARCMQLAPEGPWDIVGLSDFSRRCASIGLVGLGRLRATWTLSRTDYQAHRTVDLDQIALFLLVIRWIEQETAAIARMSSDGVVEFWRGESFAGSILLFTGRAVRSWHGIEDDAIRYAYRWREHSPAPTVAIVTGTTGVAADTAMPMDIAMDEQRDSILAPALGPEFLDLQALRQSPERIREFVHD